MYLSFDQDDEERREIEELLTQLESALSQPQDEDAENEIDEDWLTDTNISQVEVSSKMCMNVVNGKVLQTEISVSR